ncbi:adenosine deaminase family protein [Arthrobacter koreensis]|uniref:adenosine deaminase family protein n=1 Tax=Arthrobacter koreensis TaxID=199136 RepID=UPI0037F579D7
MTTETSSETAAATEPTALQQFAARIPKTDLHCHLIGTVRASTFADLAAKAGMALPEDPEMIFANISSVMRDFTPYENARIPIVEDYSLDPSGDRYSLFQASDWVMQALTEAEDLTRITYEAFEAAHRTSNTRHLELFIDDVPPALKELGYAGCIEAYAEGIRRAERDFGMSGRLIVGIDRSKDGAYAVRRVQQILNAPHEYVVGIGLDNLETAGPPERFEAAYQLAGRGGLKRTAHSSEHARVAVNTITCLDVLGCDRIDHGYFVMEDDAVIARMREEQVPFTGIFTTSRRSWRPWRRASIKAMVDAGLNVILASDDPGMFPTTLANEYRIAVDDLGLDRAWLRKSALAGVDACWLPEPEKAALKASMTAEIDALEQELFG